MVRVGVRGITGPPPNRKHRLARVRRRRSSPAVYPRDGIVEVGQGDADIVIELQRTIVIAL